MQDGRKLEILSCPGVTADLKPETSILAIELAHELAWKNSPDDLAHSNSRDERGGLPFFWVAASTCWSNFSMKVCISTPIMDISVSLASGRNCEGTTSKPQTQVLLKHPLSDNTALHYCIMIISSCLVYQIHIIIYANQFS